MEPYRTVLNHMQNRIKLCTALSRAACGTVPYSEPYNKILVRTKAPLSTGNSKGTADDRVVKPYFDSSIDQLQLHGIGACIHARRGDVVIAAMWDQKFDAHCDTRPCAMIPNNWHASAGNVSDRLQLQVDAYANLGVLLSGLGASLILPGDVHRSNIGRLSRNCINL